MRTELYINDQLADLSDETVIAITLQAMNIGNITKRVLSHTNRIRLRFTKTNDNIFELARNVNSKTRKPYQLVNIKLVQEGLEIIKSEMGILIGTNDGYQLEIYQNTLQLFDRIKEKFVDEIDIGSYNIMDTAFLNTNKNVFTSIGCPVIDYGRQLIPETIIDNNNFDGVIFDPWEMPDSNDPSFASGASLWVNGVTNKIEVTLTTTAPGTGSQFLFTAHPFHKGFQYQVLIRVQIISGSNTGNILVEMQGNMDDDPLRRQTIVNQSINTVATHTINQTVIANNDYENITLLASQITGGTNKIVRLLNIEILPVHAINIRASFYLPTIQYLTILEKILSDAGYIFNNFGIGISFLERLHITFSKSEFRYNARLTDKYHFIAHAPGTQNIIWSALADFLITMNDVEFNGSAEWYDSTVSEYQLSTLPFNLRIRLFIRLTVNVITVAATGISFILFKNGVSVSDKFGQTINQLVTTTGIKNISFELDSTLIGSAADIYKVMASSDSGSEINILLGEFYSEIENIPINILHLSNLILPDMTQSEFFTDFLFRFGAILSETQKTIKVRPIINIINDRATAKDWTNKRDHSIEDTIKYLHDSFGQINHLNDSPIEHIDAKGTFEVDNIQAVPEKTIYSSPFKVPDHIIVNGMKVVRVPIWNFEKDNRLELSNDFEDGVRLVHLRDRNFQTDPEVKYNGVVSETHKVAVYNDPLALNRAHWQFFVDTYYLPLKPFLNDAKIITRSYKLTTLDIASLDLMKLIYDDGSYYLVQKIMNFIPDKLTKVELFKVS